MTAKRPLAFYWASSCGGCEISFANLHERILEVDAHFRLVFCPCLVDTKTEEIRSLPDGTIEVTLFNGAIRTEENEEMARLLRRKSRVLVAFGACAMGGGIPALSHFHSGEEHFRSIYLDGPSLDNPERTLPREETTVPGGTLRLPRFYDRVKTLSDTVDVDYFVPGCPPESRQVSNVLGLFLTGSPLPPRGSVLGAGRSSVCDECRKTRKEKAIGRLLRIHELDPDRESCLLEQGILCMGPATRDGCGALCPIAGMPCLGCYGPPEGVHDQGAKMVSALGSAMDIDPLKGRPFEEIAREIDARLEAIPDFAGAVYKFGLSASLLNGAPECRKKETD